MNTPKLSLLSLGILIGTSGYAYADTVTVSSVAELQNAVASANSSGGNKTILVRDGTYTLNDTLYVNASNVAIIGQSGNRTKVVIQGDAMSGSGSGWKCDSGRSEQFSIERCHLAKKWVASDSDRRRNQCRCPRHQELHFARCLRADGQGQSRCIQP